MPRQALVLVCLLAAAEAAPQAHQAKGDSAATHPGSIERLALVGGVAGVAVGAAVGSATSVFGGNSGETANNAVLGAVLGGAMGAVGGASIGDGKPAPTPDNTDTDTATDADPNDDNNNSDGSVQGQEDDDAVFAPSHPVPEGESDGQDEGDGGVVVDVNNAGHAGGRLTNAQVRHGDAFSYGACEARFKEDTAHCPGLSHQHQAHERFAKAYDHEVQLVGKAFHSVHARHAGLEGTDKDNRILQNLVRRTKASLAFACKAPNSPCQSEGVAKASVPSAVGKDADCPHRLALGTDNFGHRNGMLGRWLQLAQSFQDTPNELFLGGSRLVGAAVVVCLHVASHGKGGDHFALDSAEAKAQVAAYHSGIEKAKARPSQALRHYTRALLEYNEGESRLVVVMG